MNKHSRTGYRRPDGGRPWRPELLLDHQVARDELAHAADAGIGAIAAGYRLGPLGTNQQIPHDVKFSRDEFRSLVDHNLAM